MCVASLVASSRRMGLNREGGYRDPKLSHESVNSDLARTGIRALAGLKLLTVVLFLSSF